MRRVLKYVGVALLGLLLVLAGGILYLQTDSGRSFLIAQIENAASSEAGALTIGGIDGFVPVDFAVTNVALSDSDGRWLGIDRIDLSWSPLALLAGTAEIDRIIIGTIDLPRTPLPVPAVAEEPDDATVGAPLELPSLPVAIDLRRLSVSRIVLGEPILGEPALFELTAKASLGDVGKGLKLDLNLQRLDGAADLVEAKIDYVPATDWLNLALTVNEPRGGLLTRSLGLAGNPALRVDASGSGALSDWQGNLAAVLNGQQLAGIDARVVGTNLRVVTLTADVAPAPLLPSDLVPLLADGIHLAAEIGVPSALDAIDLRQVSLQSAAVDLSVQGQVGLSGPSDLSFSGTADDAAVFRTLLPDINWRHAVVDGQVTGTWPDIQLETSASVTQLNAAGKKIGSIDLAAVLAGEDFQTAPIAFDLLLDAAGIDVGTPEANAILADGVKLATYGSFDLAGAITVESLDLKAGPIVSDGQATAKEWGAVLNAALTLSAEDLARFNTVSGMTLGGSFHADAMIDMDGTDLTLDVAAAGTGLATGIAAADGLLGPEPRLAIAVTRGADAVLHLDTFTLTGKALSADAAGTMADDALALTANATLKDLAVLEPAASGALSFKAELSGTVAAPKLRADVTSPNLGFNEFMVTGLTLGISAEDLANAPRAQIAGAANIAGLPARLGVSLLTEPDSGAIRIENLALRHGPSAISGQLRVLNGVAAGAVKLAIADLAPYAPLLDQAISGSVLGEVKLADRGGLQDVDLDLSAQNLALADTLRVAQMKLIGAVDDVTGTQAIDMRLEVAGLVTEQVQFDQTTLTAKGDVSALDVTLDAAGPEATLSLAGDLARDVDARSVTITKLAAQIRGEALALRGPARITQRGETIEIAGLDLGYGAGGIALEGTLGPSGNDVQLAINHLSLALARLADPTLQVGGELNGTVTLAGPHTAPVGRIDLAASGVTVDQSAGITLDLGLQGDWRNAMLNTTGKLTFSTGGGLDLAASLGLGADPATGLPQMAENAPLDAKVSGDLDLALANRFLAGGADRVSGKMRIDLAANGNLAAPRVAGNATLSEGRYENVRYGIKLRQLTAELRGNGDRFEVAALSARTPGGGQISASGGLSLKDDMPIEIAVALDKAQVINTDTAFAIVDARLNLVGAAKTDVSLTGDVTVRKSEIRIPDRLPASVQEIAFVEVNVPPERAKQIEEDTKPPAKTLGVTLDIRIDIPQQMAIRGRGLDAEMGGALTVTGTADQPIVMGEVAMRRGTLDLVGRRLEFNRGKVEFDGGEKIDPLLDFAAGAKAESYDITINVGGRASFPKITLSSAPPLPEDEVLSRLLFGKASGSLSPFEALQLAQAAAELAGVDTGVGMLDAVRGATGLDRLSVDSGDGTAGPSLSAGRYVGDGVYVGVKQGAGANSSAATVEIEVTPNLKLETDLGADSGKAGVNWEWDY